MHAHTHTDAQSRVYHICRIKRSTGAYVDFALATSGARKEQLEPVRVFTTRPDTLHGVTYLAVTPSHPLAARANGNRPFQSLETVCPAQIRSKRAEFPLYSLPFYDVAMQTPSTR